MSVPYVAEINVDRGEHIYIRNVITHKYNRDLPFTIRNAEWSLVDQVGRIFQGGNCDINGHEIKSFVKFDKEGTFFLRYVYQIGEETWVDNVKVKVG